MYSVFSLEYMFLYKSHITTGIREFNSKDLPLDPDLSSGKVEKVLYRDEIDERIPDVAACHAALFSESGERMTTS